jgi:acetolactate synthase-1/2/3 large subunit
MTTMTGGQAIVRTLMDHGVDVIFGLPGVQLDNLFDALHEQRQSVRTLHTRHEQGAAHMALGYAQASGKVGVCLVVPGPGVLNAGAALATAAGSNAPVLCLTGQIPSHQIGLGLGIPHELRDQTLALSGIVKWVGRADRAEDAPQVLRDAFHAMLGGRHQPVAFEMAPDIMGSEAAITLLPPEPDAAPPPLDPVALAAAAKVLAGATNPAIFVGSGVFGAEAALQQVAERLDAPVIMSRTGRGALSSRHPLAMGMLEGQALWDEIDVALVVGTRFLAPALAWGRANDVTIVRIDIDPAQAAKPRPATISLVTSAAAGLAALRDALPPQTPGRPSRADAFNAVRQAVRQQLDALEPQRSFAAVIRDALPDDAILVTDVTQLGTYIQYATPIYQPRTLITPGYQGTLGFALPTALGAKVAHPDRKVVAICGDGGFMFNVQELSTAVAHGLDVVVVLFNDGAFGNVKRIQKTSYGGRTIAVDLHNPDFVALARSFGMRGERAETPDALASALRDALAAHAPALIEVPVGELPNIWSLIRRPPSQGAAPNRGGAGS